jgi:hypothetical protein
MDIGSGTLPLAHGGGPSLRHFPISTEMPLAGVIGISKETLAFTMIIILNPGLRPKRQNSNDDPNC